MTQDLHAKIQSLIDTAVADGEERGVQVAVYVEGRLVVDAWAGMADIRTGAPVGGDTLFPVFSTLKGIQATVMHLLAERGQIEYDTPIAHYWPEFAAHGKEGITLRHALSHASGLPYMPEGVGPEQIGNWDTMCRLMAEMKPSWPPGEKLVYHPVTYGWLLGEVARRVDGRAFQPFIEEEICRPLGIDAIFSGLPAELEPRVAFLEQAPAEPQPVPANSPPHDIASCMVPLHEWMNSSEGRRACVPASNGIATARAVARHYAALLPGGVDGVELLPPERLRLATEPQAPKSGYEEGVTMKIGLGYGLRYGGSATGFGHAGYGGSTAYGDPRYRLAVGIAKNRFSKHDLIGRVTAEIRSALGMA